MQSLIKDFVNERFSYNAEAFTPAAFTGRLSAALFFPEAANPPPSSCVRAQPILYTAVAIVDEAAAASKPRRREGAAGCWCG